MSDSSYKIISNHEEEETIDPSSFDEDENDIGSIEGGGDTRATSSLPSTSPSSSRRRRRHPPPSLPTMSSRTQANSPIASRLKDHFEAVPTIVADSPGDDFQQKQQQQEETNNSYHQNNNEHQQKTKSISAASLVVCGVDGTVYTLDAYTGQLRGMFASGAALVYSSSPEEDSSTDDTSADDDDDIHQGHFDDGESNAIANTSPRWKERIVPGLDGRLYNLFQMDDGIGDDDNDADNYNSECDEDGFCEEESNNNNIIPHLGSYNLSPLPISVMDVVDSPISTCRPLDDPSQPKQCGIVVGSKKTTVYAIDPLTGKVQWTQDPLGSGGGRGFTTHPPPNKSARGLTVLLQREDYAVRHLNTDGGGEVWKVELGRFSALDFDVDAHERGGNRGTEEEEDEMYEREEDHVVGGSRRGTAAAAAAANLNGKEKKTSPILGGTRKHGALHEQKEHRPESKMFHEDDFDDHSHFRGFPSVAFGEVRLSLLSFS